MWNIPDTIDAAREHYEKLLEEAEGCRRFHNAKVYHVPYAAPVRYVLLALSNLLIALGTRIKTACDVNSFAAPRDEVIHKVNG